ncbi:hypothetical protein [Formosa haliotis]|uniref:hypothetical protein n=1 Tax=Formosa haliotis TaxID=1555194 RepID=UPI0008261771|nr:hypothetical protein [Formosa haliotis]
MKLFKFFLGFSFLLSTVSNCASQKLEKDAPIAIKEVYKKHWTSGVKGGGSGTNIFVSLVNPLPAELSLDSIYFDGFQLALNQDQNNSLLYVGRHLEDAKDDYLIKNPLVEEKEEQKTTIKTPKFQLKPNECVVKYTKLDKVKYFKYDALQTKARPLMPQAKPNRE